MKGRLKFLGELLQLVSGEIADRQEIKALLGPALEVESLNRTGSERQCSCAHGLCDEQVDDMRAPLVHDGGCRASLDVIESAADERESLRRQFDDRRGQVDPSVEPWLDRMLIA